MEQSWPGPTTQDRCVVCRQSVLPGADGDYVLTYDELGQAQWWHGRCRALMLLGPRGEPESSRAIACPTGCPTTAMALVYIPWDHLMLYCCRRCKLIQLQSEDGLVPFMAQELYALAKIRRAVRQGKRDRAG